MHPQIIFQISGDRHRENLARAERWRLARPAGAKSGGSYPRGPLTRLYAACPHGSDRQQWLAPRAARAAGHTAAA